EYFETIVNGLGASGQSACRHNSDGACTNWQRLVIEKPFGKDLETAKHLNDCLHNVFDESAIYRIDHYLGKDMIQNIMVLRFCNVVFESLWSSQYIDNIQISLGEKLGVGSRGGYYEHSGAIRDMVQNHILQILSLVAMEPPVCLNTDAIRHEKLKVIQAIEGFTPDAMRDNIVFGQYSAGTVDGEQVPGYREEPNVPVNSNTETFVAFKLKVNNFRWAGTPFYIRTGKRLNASAAEIVVQFKSLPKVLYFAGEQAHQEPNLLVIRIQPNVGVFFQLNTKDFSTQKEIVPIKVESSHLSPNQGNTPEAYERLIYDIMRGDATLFAWWNEVEASWKLADQIISFRESQRQRFPNYTAGSTGPVKAIELLARDGREWWSV
ncbi:MAG: glucose-6-phosphate dehydrogenase, partial [Firmicutes bacterium]|nr:glucose-6-phosphate dehydrogenase [Bacillota bacterium]